MMERRSFGNCYKSYSKNSKVIVPYVRSIDKKLVVEELSNGARISGEEHPGRDVGIVLVFPYGQLDHQYLSHMNEHLLFRNCGHSKEQAIDVRIERLGGFYSGLTDKDSMTLLVKTLSENARSAMRLIRKSMTDLNITEKQLSLEKIIVEGECLENRSDSKNCLMQSQEIMALRNHPLYMPKELLKNIRELKLKQVIDHKIKYIGAKNLHIGIAGPNAKYLVESAAEIFSKLPNTGNDKHEFKKHKIKRVSRILYNSAANESAVSILIPVAGYESNDQYGIELLSHILTGAGRDYESRSRFWREIRAKRGSMYHTQSFYNPYNGIGLLEFFSYGITQKNSNSVRDIMLDEIAKLTTTLIPDHEFEDVRNSLLLTESRWIENETIEESAERIAASSFYNLNQSFNPYRKKILSLTPAKVYKVAKKYFDKSNLAIATIKAA